MRSSNSEKITGIVSGDFYNFISGTEDSSVDTEGLNVGLEGLNVGPQGLNVGVEGLNVEPEGLNISSEAGINVEGSGVNVEGSTYSHSQTIHSRDNVAKSMSPTLTLLDGDRVALDVPPAVRGVDKVIPYVSPAALQCQNNQRNIAIKLPKFGRC